MRRLILLLAVLLGLPLSGEAQSVRVLRPLSKHMLSLYYWQAIPGNPNTPGGGSGASYPVSDETFKVCDNGDTTKCVELENTGITTANTIALTFTGTSAAVGISNGITWGGSQIFTTNANRVNDLARLVFGTGSDVPVLYNTLDTPDTLKIGTSADSNCISITEAADVAFDNAHPLQTQPCVIVHSEDQVVNQYTKLQAGSLTTRRTRTLTEAGGAEQLFQITTATTESGGGEIHYKIHATDGTDFAVREGVIRFVFYNAAGTVTATLSGADQTADSSVAIVSAGETLTYAITADVATANVFKFMINIDSNITVNAAHADYMVIYNGPGEVVFP